MQGTSPVTTKHQREFGRISRSKLSNPVLLQKGRTAVNTIGNGHHRAVRLTIPAKPEFITLGRLALTGIARLPESRVTQEVLGDLKLALTEACTNSVRHAYADGGGTVEILYELYDDKVVVVVADEGEGFAPPSQRDDALEDGELSEGGLGIAIIEALSDEFEIAEGDRGGARLRFVKHLTV